MAMPKIITVPNPLLRQKSKPVKKINHQVKKLATEMLKIIEGDEGAGSIGVGLSAVQVGIPIRLLIAYSKQTNHYFTMINPKIIWQSKKMTKGVPESENIYEGCLSVPGYFGIVKRPKSIKVEYQLLSSRRQRKKFSGFVATVIQHEIDHLNGVLFVDRLLQQKGKLFKPIKDKSGKETFIEVTLNN